MEPLSSKVNVMKPNNNYIKIGLVIVILLVLVSLSLIVIIIYKNNNSSANTISYSTSSSTNSLFSIQNSSSSRSDQVTPKSYNCHNPIFLNADKTTYVCKIIIAKEQILNYKICQDKRNKSPTNDKAYDNSVIPEIYNIYSSYLDSPMVINATIFKVNESICDIANINFIKDHHLVSDKLIFFGSITGVFGAPTDATIGKYVLDLQNNQIQNYDGGGLNFDLALIDNNIVVIPGLLGYEENPKLLIISGYDLNSHKLLKSIRLSDTSKVPDSFKKNHPNEPLINFYENKKAELISLTKLSNLKYQLNYKIVNNASIQTIDVENDPNYIENDTYIYNLN